MSQELGDNGGRHLLYVKINESSDWHYIQSQMYAQAMDSTYTVPMGVKIIYNTK